MLSILPTLTKLSVSGRIRGLFHVSATQAATDNQSSQPTGPFASGSSAVWGQAWGRGLLGVQAL